MVGVDALVVCELTSITNKVCKANVAKSEQSDRFSSLRGEAWPRNAKIKKPLAYEWFLWWALRGSNSRHPPCKGGALPTELNAQNKFVYLYYYIIFFCQAFILYFLKII